MEMTGIERRLERIEQLLEGTKEVMDTRECSRFLGIDVSTLRHKCSARQIPYYKRDGRNYFKRSEIEKWMLGVRVKTDEELESEAVTRCVLNRRKA